MFYQFCRLVSRPAASLFFIFYRAFLISFSVICSVWLFLYSFIEVYIVFSFLVVTLNNILLICPLLLGLSLLFHEYFVLSFSTFFMPLLPMRSQAGYWYLNIYFATTVFSVFYFPFYLWELLHILLFVFFNDLVNSSYRSVYELSQNFLIFKSEKIL